jgi:phosphoglycerate dehydrogenase-like enzyme
MRVLTQLPSGYLEPLRQRFPAVDFSELPLSGPAPHDSAEVLYTWSRRVTNVGDVLDDDVKWVHSLGTGVDDFPFDLLGDRIFTCARGAASIPISEWVLAVMLAFEKAIPSQWLKAPSDNFHLASLGTLDGRNLSLVGFGSIGQRVARHAIGFGMNVSALRRTESPSPVAGVTIVHTIDELLADADHVVVAAPLTPATTELLNGAAFASMKQGVHIVNVARGGLIDHDALRGALDNGTVACASLDTTTPEPLPVDHWLYEHPRVRLSPHVSWGSPYALDTTLNAFTGNLDRWMCGEPLVGVVNRHEGY